MTFAFCEYSFYQLNHIKGNKGGVVVSALASCQCGSPLLKNQHSKFQLDLESVPQLALRC